MDEADIPVEIRRQAARALVGALRGMPPQDRASGCLWFVREGLMGIAHEVGAREAAAIAYQFADLLASVRSRRL